MPVQRIVGGVEIEHDPLGRRAMRVKKQLDRQLLDRRRIIADLAIPVRPGWRMLQPVEGALAGERRAIRPPRFELAGEDRHHRVVAQPVMVDEVFVSQSDPDHPLTDQRRDSMLDPRPVPAVAEAGREPLNQADDTIGSPSSSALASEVTAPPSNAATTKRLSTVPNAS